MADIFSDDNTPLDTSPEAIEALPVLDEPDAADVVEAHDIENEELENEAPDDVDEDDENEDNEEEADPPVDNLLDNDLVKGKSPEELAKFAIDTQSMIGRQSAEVSELRRVTEEQAGQIRELIGYLNDVQQQPASQVDTNDLVARAVDNPIATYNQAIQMLDDGKITPDILEEIIDATSDMDPKLALKMERDFTRRMAVAEVRAEMDQRIAPVESGNYQTQFVAATTSLKNDPVLGADVKEYAKEISQLFTGPDGKLQQLGSTEQEIRSRITSALTVAIGNDPQRSAKYKSALEQMRIDAQTDAGNPPEPVVKKSEADEYRDRVMRKAAERDPGAALFA